MSFKVITDKVAGVLKNIKQIENARVLVGIPKEENSRSDDPIGNAGIGYVQEFGSPARNIPARPFLVPGVKEVQDKTADILKDGASKVLDNGTMIASLTKAGIIAQNSVKATITKGEGFKPLSNVTIELRRAKKQGEKINGKRVGEAYKASQSAFFVPAKDGQYKPLIETGQLRNSITYIVKGA